MANKLKRRIGTLSHNQLAATVRESAQQIWLAGLGAFATARTEGNKVFDALAKEGEAIQSLMQKAAKASVRGAAAKATLTRRRLEKRLEDSVARSLRRFGVPARKDLDTLSKRVATLTALIDKTRAEVSRKRAAAKHAATGVR